MQIQRRRRLRYKPGLGIPEHEPPRARPTSTLHEAQVTVTPCDICGSKAEGLRIVGGGFLEEGHVQWMKRVIAPDFDPDQTDNQICLCRQHYPGAVEGHLVLIPSEEDLNALILLQSKHAQSPSYPTKDRDNLVQPLSGWFEYLPVYIRRDTQLLEYFLACTPHSFSARLPVRVQSTYRPEFARILGKTRRRRDGRVEVYIGDGRLNVWALVLHGLTALGGVTLHETPRFTAVHRKLLQLRTLCNRRTTKLNCY